MRRSLFWILRKFCSSDTIVMGNGMNKVVPGVYVGNIRDSKDWKQFDEHNITHILSIHDNAKKILPTMQYLCIQVGDHPSEDLTKYFPQCNDFIHNARLSGGNVLIHCLAGVSRSVTVTCAYLMTVTNLSWRDSLNAVRGARRVANPNFGFQKQLQHYEHENLAREKARFRISHKSVSHDDDAICHQLLLAHERYVLYGDKADSMDESTYPLGSDYHTGHNAYASNSASKTTTTNGSAKTSNGSTSKKTSNGSTSGSRPSSSEERREKRRSRSSSLSKE